MDGDLNATWEPPMMWGKETFLRVGVAMNLHWLALSRGE